MVVVAAEWAEGWWAMKTFTVDEVRAVLERLESRAVASGVGDECLLVIQQVAEEVLGQLGAAGDELLGTVLAARSVEEFDEGVARLGLFEDRLGAAASRSRIDQFWQPSPKTNEAMLAALEVYAEKQAGALSRGASQTEARTFARMEARRVYRQLVRGGS